MISIAICENEAAHLQILEQALDTNMQEMDIPYTVEIYRRIRRTAQKCAADSYKASCQIVPSGPYLGCDRLFMLYLCRTSSLHDHSGTAASGTFVTA